MGKQAETYKFLICVPDWTGSEFRLHESGYDNFLTAAEEFIEEHDNEHDNEHSINHHNGIEVLIRRAEDGHVHKVRVSADIEIHYNAKFA
jgi:hypothetical protein